MAPQIRIDSSRPNSDCRRPEGVEVEIAPLVSASASDGALTLCSAPTRDNPLAAVTISLPGPCSGGGTLVQNYRFYFPGPKDRIVRASDVSCADDADAIAKAERLRAVQGIEIWNGRRKVGFVAAQIETDPA